jgi:hypothetical protein
MNRARILLDPRAADRLAKICGMLGAAHDGERAAAAAKADELVRSLGLTWREVIAVPAPSIAPQTSDWKMMAGYCHGRPWLMREKEREFVRSILNWRRELTEKQKDWLCAIYSRVHGAGR